MANRICNRCGAQFSFSNGARKYCDECREADKSLSYNQAYYEAHKAPAVEEDRACGFCGAMFRCSTRARRKFCSDDCRTQATRERIKAENKQRREFTTLICPYCGSSFHVSSNFNQKYCSQSCSRKATRDNYSQQCSADGCVRPVRARGMCSMHYHRWRRATVGEPNPVWDERRRANYELRRARKKTNGPVEKFLNVEVFERDDWLCGLCGEQVDKDLMWPDPMSASLDHIIPLSRGGEHTLDNVQLAHLVCNIRKNNQVTASL